MMLSARRHFALGKFGSGTPSGGGRIVVFTTIALPRIECPFCCPFDQPYDGAMAVIRARTRGFGQWTPPAPDLGWGALARGGVDTHLVNGAHDTILREPRCARSHVF